MGAFLHAALAGFVVLGEVLLEGVTVYGSWFMVVGQWLMVNGLGNGDWGLGFGVWGLGLGEILPEPRLNAALVRARGERPLALAQVRRQLPHGTPPPTVPDVSVQLADYS